MDLDPLLVGVGCVPLVLPPIGTRQCQLERVPDVFLDLSPTPFVHVTTYGHDEPQDKGQREPQGDE